MNDIEKKLMFLLATSPYLDTVDGTYEKAARDLIKNGVTIDPASLRPKGEWVVTSWWQRKTRYTVKTCSICKGRVKPKFKYNFCPNCGADMRGETHDS